ncbi:restriction endonuclease subunit S, partial [bacterium]|nr:restriction endonuclease subunit S [bacterium]
DILISVRAPVGEINIAPHKCCIGRGIAAVQAKDIHDKFLYQSMLLYRKNLQKMAQGSTFEAVNRKELAELLSLLPPFPEQEKIADILSTVDKAIEKTAQVIEKTKELKKGLMQSLLTRGIEHNNFKKTEIGDLPEEWEVRTLQEMIDQQIILGHLDGNHGSLYPRQCDFSDKGILYLAANCLVNGQVDFKVAKHITTEKASTLKKGFAKDLDVLFAHNATVGPVSVLRTNKDFVILSTSLTYYRSNRTLLNPFYLYHYMDSEIFKKQYKRIMEQTTRNQVPITTQRKLCHLIPPKIEQDRIAEILSELDTRIREELVYKSELDTLKKGLMQVLLTGKLRVAV